MTNKQFSDYYKKTEVTDDYDRQRLSNSYRRNKRQKELKIFLSLLNKKTGERVLEIGCSSGQLTKFLGKVTAIDTSKDMLKITKQKNPQAKVYHLDMFDLPKPFKRKFDKIVSIRVLTHLSEKELLKVLKKINKTMKKDGLLVFDLEEYSVLRQIARLIYTDFFNIFRKNPIRGYKVYQYKKYKAFEILREAGFDIWGIEYLKHKIGKQFMIQARKAREI